MFVYDKLNECCTHFDATWVAQESSDMNFKPQVRGFDASQLIKTHGI